MKRILMVAFHFPPQAGSSGIQRTLRFVQYLPSIGWQPIVLTANARAYESTDENLSAEVPADAVVRRAFALDTARHLQFRRRYLGWMARPDRWVSWQWDGVRQGTKLVEEFKPEVIWSTYPIATAHNIASALHRKTGIPWVADFRDPMAQEGYPADPQTWQSFQRIEADAAANASLCVFTTPGAAQTYKERYPKAAHRMVVVENGFDEANFVAAEQWRAQRSNASQGRQARARGPVTLLHSGIVYPSERDPAPLFLALGRLKQRGVLGPLEARLRFRASVHDDLLRTLALTHGVEDLIEICPPLPYREALAEMLDVDALLLMQASNCNAQIPAKWYEYLRAGKPVLGLTDPLGDTAGAMRSAGLPDIVRLDHADDIAAALPDFVRRVSEGKAALPDKQVVQQASRLARTKALSDLLQGIQSP